MVPETQEEEEVVPLTGEVTVETGVETVFSPLREIMPDANPIIFTVRKKLKSFRCHFEPLTSKPFWLLKQYK